MREIVVRLAGAAGQGVQSMGELLARAVFKHGLFLHGELSYHSRIRGGENAFTLRISDRPVLATTEKAHILVALNEEMLVRYLSQVREDGLVLCDQVTCPLDRPHLHVPATMIAKEKLGFPLAVNTVLVGALSNLLGLDLPKVQEAAEEVFGEKAEPNLKAVELGYASSPSERFPLPDPRFSPGEMMLLTGGQAVGGGAIAAGCRFLASYPMTPGTPVMEFLAQRAERFGIVVEQAEDEIAAINMALGASYAGARSLVTTSGGGFALMVEGLSLAGMIETPVVLHLGQRPGPATGLPTRTGQENLLFVIHAGHGEFPRYLAAPSTAEDAFYLTVKAFELAERFQVPAFILTDQFLVDSYWVVPALDPERIPVRAHTLNAEELAEMPQYNRFELTPSGVSPRAVPGISEKLVLVDSDEHDLYGRITEDLSIRKAMVDKRLRKGKGLREEIAGPMVHPQGDTQGKTVLLGWGSTFGAIREAVESLGEGFAHVHLTEVWPLPQELFDLLSRAREVMVVEGNATAQLAQLISQEMGLRITKAILRYDGRPIDAEYILRNLTSGQRGRG